MSYDFSTPPLQSGSLPVTPGPVRTGAVFTVVSGKGGTGKSTVAANLAVTLAASGRTVALIDADPCQSSCAMLLNESPAASLLAVSRAAIPIGRAFRRTASGVTLAVAGEATRPDDLTPEFYAALTEAVGLAAAYHDVVLVDAPAGLEQTVRWALDCADAALLVVVGEPAAVTGAYSLVKSVWHVAPTYPFLLAVNAADTDVDAAQTADRFAELTAQFLGQSPASVGWLPYDAQVRTAARAQVPVVQRSAALRGAFANLAAALDPLFVPVA